MRKSRFSEDQIVSILKEHAAGEPTGTLCRQHGISEQTLYRWRHKYDGLDGQDLRRLKALEEENARLKRLVAEQALDNQALKELLRCPADWGGVATGLQCRASPQRARLSNSGRIRATGSHGSGVAAARRRTLIILEPNNGGRSTGLTVLDCDAN